MNISLKPGNCIKVPMIPQAFPANEKLVIFMFEMTAGGATGLMKIVLPTSFVGFLLRQLMAAHSKRTSSSRNLAKPTLKERILDCEITLSADADAAAMSAAVKAEAAWAVVAALICDSSASAYSSSRCF